MQVFQRIGQAMYQTSSQAARSAPPERADVERRRTQAEPESEDDVVEGEIVDEGGAS